MLHYLNTLNPLEYAQYEAYRRSTFRGDLISKFVASCLIQIEQERFAQRAHAKEFLTSQESFSSHAIPPSQDTKKMKKKNDEHFLELRLNVQPTQRYHDIENCINPLDDLQLDPLVEPHAAPEITIAVSSLAKNYANRLIQASRSVASEQGYDEHAALLPTHVLEAYRQRSQSGLDPGFFLQPSYYQNSTTTLGGLKRRKYGIGYNHVSSCTFICPESDATNRSNRVFKSMATLASQELYDQLVRSIGTGSTSVEDTPEESIQPMDISQSTPNATADDLLDESNMQQDDLLK